MRFYVPGRGGRGSRTGAGITNLDKYTCSELSGGWSWVRQVVSRTSKRPPEIYDECCHIVLVTIIAREKVAWALYGCLGSNKFVLYDLRTVATSANK